MSPFVTTSDLAILIVVMANSLYTVDVEPDGLAEIGRIDVLFLPNTNRETISFCNTYSLHNSHYSSTQTCLFCQRKEGSGFAF